MLCAGNALLQLHHDAQRAARLGAEAHAGHHAGRGRGADTGGERRVGQVEDHPVGMIEGKELLRRAAAEIQGHLGELVSAARRTARSSAAVRDGKGSQAGQAGDASPVERPF